MVEKRMIITQKKNTIETTAFVAEMRGDRRSFSKYILISNITSCIQHT